METFKVTSWNIEHSDKLLTGMDSTDDTKKRYALARLDAISEVISACGADILFVSEGPSGEDRARMFFDIVAPDYDLIIRNSDQRKSYGIDNGTQWLWFLIRKGTTIRGSLQHLDHWENVVERASRGAHKAGKWDVSFPAVNSQTNVLEFVINETWDHYRHPQVLQAEVDGHYFEIIGCHLRSKHTQVKPVGRPDDDAFFSENPELVSELIADRVKLVTECIDVRYYIDSRFEEQTDSAIIVVGDLNDGPGKERVERRFLYQDLVTALQGDVFFARRFLNHALFDAPDEERWSVSFDDPLDHTRSPFILLDHILFSQPMTSSHTGQKFPFLAEAKAGKVEHEIFHRVTSSRFKYATPSDHRPISMTFSRRQE